MRYLPDSRHFIIHLKQYFSIEKIKQHLTLHNIFLAAVMFKTGNWNELVNSISLGLIGNIFNQPVEFQLDRTKIFRNKTFLTQVEMSDI